MGDTGGALTLTHLLGSPWKGGHEARRPPGAGPPQALLQSTLSAEGVFFSRVLLAQCYVLGQ